MGRSYRRRGPRLARIFSDEIDLLTCSRRISSQVAFQVLFYPDGVRVFEAISGAVLDSSSAEASGPLCRRVIREASDELRDGFVLDYILEGVLGMKAVA